MKQYFSFQWHITDDCDQRCKHCYIFSENTCKHLDSMSWAEMQETFYNCLDFCAVHDRLPYFYITGGDPILHPDFWQLLELLKTHSIPFTILGNPFHLNDAVCQRLKNYGCEKYQLSIDGLRETHDWFRKPGSFDTTLEKIGCINRAGIRSVVMTTVSGKNIDEVPGIIDAVVAAGANVFAFARYCPTSGEKDTGIAPLRYRQPLADCDKKFKEYEAAGCTTYFNKKDHLWTLYEYETGTFTLDGVYEDGMIYGGCNCFSVTPAPVTPIRRQSPAITHGYCGSDFAKHICFAKQIRLCFSNFVPLISAFFEKIIGTSQKARIKQKRRQTVSFNDLSSFWCARGNSNPWPSD